MIRQDEIGSGSADGGEDFHRHTTFVDHAGGGGGLHHRVLAAHVVRADRQRGGLTHTAEHVEVSERRLDHQHVGALFFVETRLAKPFARISRIHLVGRAVAELGRAIGRVAKRPVERRGVFHGVREDGEVFVRRLVEGLPNRRDAPVHHVARGDHVGTGIRVDERDAREHLERRVVVDVDHAVTPRVENAAVAVVGVLVDTNVGHHDDLGRGVFHRPNGHRHGPFGIGPRFATRIFVLRETKENDASETGVTSLAGDPRRVRDGVLRDARHRAYRAGLVDARVKKQREHEVLRADRRLANETTERRGPAKTTGAVEERHRADVS
jgi:hypothetical protein